MNCISVIACGAPGSFVRAVQHDPGIANCLRQGVASAVSDLAEPAVSLERLKRLLAHVDARAKEAAPVAAEVDGPMTWGSHLMPPGTCHIPGAVLAEMVRFDPRAALAMLAASAPPAPEWFDPVMNWPFPDRELRTLSEASLRVWHAVEDEESLENMLGVIIGGGHDKPAVAVSRGHINEITAWREHCRQVEHDKAEWTKQRNKQRLFQWPAVYARSVWDYMHELFITAETPADVPGVSPDPSGKKAGSFITGAFPPAETAGGRDQVRPNNDGAGVAPALAADERPERSPDPAGKPAYGLLPDPEYLGDGLYTSLYVSFDGFSLWLSTGKNDCTNSVPLDREVFQKLVAFAKKCGMVPAGGGA